MSEIINLDFHYPSRNLEIPATITFPMTNSHLPLVLMCHGHGGERNEHGGFTQLAKDLAKRGIASIRMDFSGSGQSKEDFSANCLTNMKIDVISCLNYAVENFHIQKDHIGLLGYSMGGRVSLELLQDRVFDVEALTLIAPAAHVDDLKRIFIKSGFERLYQQASISPYGYTTFKDEQGRIFHLGKSFFVDLCKNPKDYLIERAANSYHNQALVIYSTDDPVILPNHSKKVATTFNAKEVILNQDGHCYGFLETSKEPFLTVSKEICDFFEEELIKKNQ